MITENLSTLKIHKLTQDQYDREKEAGNIDANALYLTPDEKVDLSGYATTEYVDSKVGDKSVADQISSAVSTIDTSKWNYVRASCADYADLDSVLLNFSVSTAYNTIIKLIITSGGELNTDLTTKNGKDTYGKFLGIPVIPVAIEEDQLTACTARLICLEDNTLWNYVTGGQLTKLSDSTDITHSWDGTTLTVTSASGTSSADLKGADGKSPVVKATDVSDGVALSIESPDGAISTTKIKHGKDGYTPVKGVDYFTEADKNEIINYLNTNQAYPAITYEYAEGGYWNNQNSWTTDATYRSARTNMIPVTTGDKLSYQGYGMYNVPSVIWFDKNQNILSYENDSAVSNAVIKTAPINAAYAIFCAFSSESTVHMEVVWVLCQAVDGADTPYSPLYGKKIAYDGDSICYGAGYKGGYAKLIAEKVAGTYDNQAVGGARLVTKGSNSWHSVVDNLPNLPTDADLYCFNGGINDYWAPNILGTYDYTNFEGELDTTTVCGALETIFRYCLNNFVGKPVCFIITHKIQKTAYKENANGDSFKDYHDAMVGICEKYSIPYYDAFTESGLNGWNTMQSNTFLTGSSDGTADGCHPNEEGYKRYYVPQLISLFESIMPADTQLAPTSPSYTNALDEAGITEGYRLSTSTGGIKENSNTDVTGFIPCVANDRIYLKNITAPISDSANYSGTVCYYDASKTFVTGFYVNTIDTTLQDENGNISRFIVQDMENTAYLRFCAQNIDDTSIITVNEPIE